MLITRDFSQQRKTSCKPGFRLLQFNGLRTRSGPRQNRKVVSETSKQFIMYENLGHFDSLADLIHSVQLKTSQKFYTTDDFIVSHRAP